jgi:predicted Fe-Mo cluster-binding NifX family protein
MKIAVVSDDGQTISEHFGRAAYYIVVTVEGDQIANSETRPKAGHHSFVGQPHPEPGPEGRRGYGAGSEARHQTMAQTIADCQAIITRGMGWGAFESLRSYGIDPVVTDERDIREAALRYAKGDLPNLMDRLH